MHITTAVPRHWGSHKRLSRVQWRHGKWQLMMVRIQIRAIKAEAFIGFVLVGLLLVSNPLVGWADTTEDSWIPWHSKTDRYNSQDQPDRQHLRALLKSRLEPEYSSFSPYVSLETISAIKIAAKRYRSIVSSGGWPRVEYNKTLRVNDTDEQVRYLRRRLTSTGDLRENSGSGKERWFDKNVQHAVGRFQARHGLGITGFLDRQTRHALNTSASAHLQTLEVNLDRLQRLSDSVSARRYVLVNIPAFSLQAVDRNRLSLQSRVVVGRPDRETPSLSTKIRELNFYPYWRVPDSIASRDLIPQLRRDPSYLTREHFSILPHWGGKPLDPYRVDRFSPKIFERKFRQDPGPFNALGVLRLNMPNKHTVYLHDTPLKKLFDRSYRAYSSGCVRVRKIQELAAWLLKEQDDLAETFVQTTVSLGQSRDIKLKKPVPVHFVYVTAWATDNGIVHFRRDIYKRDNIGTVVVEVEKEKLRGNIAITP